MIEIAHLKESDKIKEIPRGLQEIILKIVVKLDSEYGVTRSKYEDDGGYVIVIESEKDFEKLKNKNDIDCDEIIPEYVDKIICNDGKAYTNSLILCNNDFGISIIIPMELTPQNLKNYMIE